MKFSLQYPADQGVDQKIDQKIDQRLAKSHPPGQYLDIVLARGQYKIYCPRSRAI